MEGEARPRVFCITDPALSATMMLRRVIKGMRLYSPFLTSVRSCIVQFARAERLFCGEQRRDGSKPCVLYLKSSLWSWKFSGLAVWTVTAFAKFRLVSPIRGLLTRQKMGSGLEISVFFQRLNDLAHRRVMDPQMIGNRLQRITMLDMRAINLLIPFRFVSCFYK